MKIKSVKDSTEEWRTVKDTDVRHIWRHYDAEGKCPYSMKEIVIPPTFYNENKTPACPDCGEDYEYIRTEVRP